MNSRTSLIGFVLLALSLGYAQTPAPEGQTTSSSMTFHAESRLVLVDAIVTDKHGNYIHDLLAKDFRVYEDGKEQTIKSFSFEADPAAPANLKRHYMVLFFDNASMQSAQQTQAREAAAKFIDANAGPDSLMAVVNFGGSLNVAQNFTPDSERLKRIVAGEKIPTTASNAELDPSGATLTNAELEYGQYTMLLALRTLARRLAGVPGRKMLVLLSAGFKLDADGMTDLSATIDVCNKANVAVYPVDARGLALGVPTSGSLRWPAEGVEPVAYHGGAKLRLASFSPPSPQVAFQKGGTGGKPAPGGGTTGRPSGGTGTRPITQVPPPRTSPLSTLAPHFPPSTMENQQPLYALAVGTGGFLIANTNDLATGMQKIASEQNQYYLLGYTPASAPDGSCHSLKVKVDRGDTIVRARSGYCSTKPVDLLAGSAVQKELEGLATGAKSGTVQTSLSAPFFYTAPNVARVHVIMSIPPDAMKIEKQQGKYVAMANILGVAVDKQATIAARFSDSVKVELDGKPELDEFKKHPYRYEKQFEVPSGNFRLKTVVSTGSDSFGKAEIPLYIDPNDGQEFGISGIALSNHLINLAQNPDEQEDALLEDRTPLIVNHMQIVPSATNDFKKTDMAVLYVEVYEPLLKSEKPPVVALDYRVLDRKSGQLKFDSGMMNLSPSIRPGNPVIPVGMKLVTDKLDPGDYRLEVQAKDSTGTSSLVRTVEFKVE